MLDHTADVGFELEAPTLEALFDAAREGLLEILMQRPPRSGSEERVVELSARDLEALMVRWINELVYLVQTAGFVPARADITVSGQGGKRSLRARLAGEPLDPEAHGWLGEVKSATFHGLCVEAGDGGWRARVILDV
jgi:SHS2 domain-containing protein